MLLRSSKAAALLGGVVSLALFSSLLLRASASKPKTSIGPCAPRLLELDNAVCAPLPTRPPNRLLELSHRVAD